MDDNNNHANNENINITEEDNDDIDNSAKSYQVGNATTTCPKHDAQLFKASSNDPNTPIFSNYVHCPFQNGNLAMKKEIQTN